VLFLVKSCKNFCSFWGSAPLDSGVWSALHRSVFVTPLYCYNV